MGRAILAAFLASVLFGAARGSDDPFDPNYVLPGTGPKPRVETPLPTAAQVNKQLWGGTGFGTPGAWRMPAGELAPRGSRSPFPKLRTTPPRKDVPRHQPSLRGERTPTRYQSTPEAIRRARPSAWEAPKVDLLGRPLGRSSRTGRR